MVVAAVLLAGSWFGSLKSPRFAETQIAQNFLCALYFSFSEVKPVVLSNEKGVDMTCVFSRLSLQETLTHSSVSLPPLRGQGGFSLLGVLLFSSASLCPCTPCGAGAPPRPSPPWPGAGNVLLSLRWQDGLSQQHGLDPPDQASQAWGLFASPDDSA